MRTQRCLFILFLAFVTLFLAACGDDDNDHKQVVPTPPTEVTATGGFQQVTISWAAVSNAGTYNIYWSTTEGVTPDTGTKIANVTSPYVQTGLTPGTTYYYVVTAENNAGESAPSDEVSAIPTNVPTVPVAPTGVSATGADSQVSITWNAVADATSYNIYWATSTGVTPATGTKISDVTTPFVQTGLTNGTTYYYVVTAVNSTGEGPPSAEVSATPTGAATVPAAPTGVSATAGDSQVTIAWSAVSGATSYNIYWATSSGVTPATGTLIANATSPHVQTGLTNGTTYYYVVTAVNSAGESGPSTEVSATAAAATVPAAPTGVSATAGDSQVTIAWSVVSGATSYNIYWATTSGVTPATGTLIANATSPHVQTGLTNGTTYYYVVTAVNSAGEGSPSTQVSATPAAALDGVALYGTYCSGCHGPLASTDIVNKTVSGINNAISSVSAMSSLSSLTQAQIQAISDALLAP